MSIMVEAQVCTTVISFLSKKIVLRRPVFSVPFSACLHTTLVYCDKMLHYFEGYGREYRERLLRRWGIVDVDDCCGCAKYLVCIFFAYFYVETKIPKHVWFGQVSSGKADVKRLCISGGSAGGYTTLAALAFRDVFKAGASLYGVSTLIL